MAKDTRTELLDEAQRLVQERGFNAFSYRDLARTLGIKTASIHYHFPTKGDLGLALIERYTEQLQSDLKTIEKRHTTPADRIGAFIDGYRSTQRAGAMCLCGALATDLVTLPEPIRPAVARYMKHSEDWLERTIEQGIDEGEFQGDAPDLAAMTLSTLQGALVVSRTRTKTAARDLMTRVKRTVLGALH